ncbi:MAG: thioredoxin [Oligoflexales bacterium]
MSNVRTYDSENKELNGTSESGYTVVDFYADWCGPCQSFAPRFDKLAAGFNGKIDFVKVNVDAAPELAQKFGIRSIPTVVVLKGQQEVVRSVGAPRASDLEAYLYKLLEGTATA